MSIAHLSPNFFKGALFKGLDQRPDHIVVRGIYAGDVTVGSDLAVDILNFRHALVFHTEKVLAMSPV